MSHSFQGRKSCSGFYPRQAKLSPRPVTIPIRPYLQPSRLPASVWFAGSHIHSFSEMRWPSQGSTQGYLVVDSHHLPNLEECSNASISDFNAHLKVPQEFPQGCALYKWPFKRLYFHCSSICPVTRPLAIICGLLSLFNLSTPARKAACWSACQADLFLPSSISVEVFQTGCCLFTLGLLSTNSAAVSQLRASYRAQPEWQWNLTLFTEFQVPS